ncbi:MAG: Nramp family divalent metal transporter [Thermoleophilia bacterium]|nr:Nramp family divalent metal transporter [Thermoleophilia bacterium]
MSASPPDTGSGSPAGPGPQLDLPVSPLGRVKRRGKIRGRLGLMGPAFVAAVAYIDPGNFATNFEAGAKFGYTLAWVIVMANLMAMLVQYLSAKAGLASGKSLPELCRESFPRTTNFFLWVQAEIVAIATDLAEFVGAAVGLNLLFGVPLFPAGLITAVIALAILTLEQRGYRKFELAIVGLLGLVALGFIYDLIAVGDQSASGIASGLVPGFSGSDSVLLAIGIIGATVMPHVIYLHSALTQRRIVPVNEKERQELLRYTRIDCIVGLGIAGLINLSMLFVAVALFNKTGNTGVDSIEAAYDGLLTLVGGGAALAFAVALLASGLSSSSVGTYAGQVVMQGFIRRSIPLYLRRMVTMTPALVVLAVGLPTTQTLVLSQVVLSFGIPFALIPLILVTRKAELMGTMVNRPHTTAVATVVATIISALNVYLIYSTIFG